MIRIPSSPHLEARLLHQLTGRLPQGQEDKISEKAKLWRLAVRTPITRLEVKDKLRFRLLHRQFAGRGVPALPTAVAAGRLFIRILRRFRWRA